MGLFLLRALNLRWCRCPNNRNTAFVSESEGLIQAYYFCKYSSSILWNTLKVHPFLLLPSTLDWSMLSKGHWDMTLYFKLCSCSIKPPVLFVDKEVGKQVLLSPYRFQIKPVSSYIFALLLDVFKLDCWNSFLGNIFYLCCLSLRLYSLLFLMDRVTHC